MTNTSWCSYGQQQIGFTLPDIPDGEYLIRPEHIALHGAASGHAEIYYSCLQVKVEGGRGTLDGPSVRIPGVYHKDDPAIKYNIWGPSDYPYIPGPDVIAGGQVRGNGNGDSHAVVTVSGGSDQADDSTAAPPEATVTETPTTTAAVTDATSIVATTLTTLTLPAATTPEAPAANPTDSAGGDGGDNDDDSSCKPRIPKYGQCGGRSFSGQGKCAEGLKCHRYGSCFSQCL